MAHSRLPRLTALAGALLAPAFLGGCGDAPRSATLAVATAGTGGVYYLLGGALAELWTRELPDHIAVAEVTGGSVENLNLLLRREVAVAFSMGTNALQAHDAAPPFAGYGQGEVLALAALYPNVLHLVTLRDSEVGGLEDFRGRRISVGAPGSGTEVGARTLLEANGITYDDIRVQRLNFNETANALRDGQADVGFWSVGVPTGSVMDLATARSVRLLSLTPQEVERARGRDGTLRRYLIAAGTYPGQDEVVETVATPNVLVVRRDLPDELAHALARSLFQGAGRLAEVHPVARSVTPEYTLENAAIPLHPGVVRYLEEEGYTVPAHLRIGGG